MTLRQTISIQLQTKNVISYCWDDSERLRPQNVENTV